MRRAITALVAGLIVTVVLLPFVTWGPALVAGWNVAALTILLTIWPVIIRADNSLAPLLAAREDETEGAARVLLVGASVASLLGAGYALHLAGQDNGAPRVLLIGLAVLTVVLSWTVINTVYTLRYADQYFRSEPGDIAFGTEDDQQHPSYRDFAYVAFTIGMCWPMRSVRLQTRPDEPSCKLSLTWRVWSLPARSSWIAPSSTQRGSAKLRQSTPCKLATRPRT